MHGPSPHLNFWGDRSPSPPRSPPLTTCVCLCVKMCVRVWECVGACVCLHVCVCTQTTILPAWALYQVLICLMYSLHYSSVQMMSAEMNVSPRDNRRENSIDPFNGDPEHTLDTTEQKWD